MKERFSRVGQQKKFWSETTKILVAVSGGVDSMVLLDLLLAAQQKNFFALGVVHINHQLRVESAEEEHYLQTYTAAKNLPFIPLRGNGLLKQELKQLRVNFVIKLFLESCTRKAMIR